VKFIDEVTITIRSGSGGPGCVSFRRERFIPKGGPDGGDGGKGADVILSASSQKRTLHDFRFKRQFNAPNGQSGQGRQKAGKSGEDLIIPIPPGTLVINAETDEVIKDFIEPGESFRAAKGGRGGLGNARFKTSTHQAPRFAQPGEPGESFILRLELKLLADVGIVGFPNAGKSTLISAISSARPKIGDYPFTTLTPNLGVVYAGQDKSFVVADIPGLIEGAHEGAGLGIQFLRHVERTTILIHLIDASEIDPDDPLSRWRAINKELESYSPELARKPQMVVLNKMDIPEAGVGAGLFGMAAGRPEFLRVSAASGQGLDALKSRILQFLNQSHDRDA
jgi:GTP-binding protein